MSIVLDILRTYRAPREVARRRIGNTAREDRAIAVLMGACLLIFVAQWPRLALEAHVDDSISLEARMAGALFGWLFVAPLVFYVFAAAANWLLRLFGRHSTGYQSRVVLFWALLAATPLFLLAGLLSGLAADSSAVAVVGVVAFAVFLVFWGAGLSVIAPRIEKG